MTNIEPLTPAVAYVRVSTVRQGKRGNGLEAQRTVIERYAAATGLRIIAWERDTLSGAKRARPGLDRSLAHLDDGTATALVVAKIDRLGRSVVDLGKIVDRYFGQGSRHVLLSASDSIDTRTPSGRLVLNVLASVAQWERETIVERTCAGLDAKRARGERLGGPLPYGYQDVDGNLAPDAAEQAVIAQARAHRAGGLSLRRTAAALARAGRRSRAGRTFTPQAIASMCEGDRSRG